jgi:hypothetical protein
MPPPANDDKYPNTEVIDVVITHNKKDARIRLVGRSKGEVHDKNCCGFAA